MDIHSLLSTFSSVLHEHSGMGYFIDLLMKSLFVVMLMVLINMFTRKLAASMRHLVWCVGFICLFTLPLFIGLLPKISVPISATPQFLAQGSMTQDIVSFADNINLALAAWWNAFLGVYFVLLFIQLFYILLGFTKVFSLSRAACFVENKDIHAELNNLILEEGLTVTVALKKSREVYSPVSWGLFSPEIILPEQAENWDMEIIRNVLIHELSHIQRLDWLTSLIVRISRAIYWFNPLVWYAARKLDEEAEQSCDDAVILNGRCHNEYASNLLEIANNARVGSLGNVIVQAIAGSFLGSRVFSILDTSKKRQQTEVVWVVRGMLVGCTVIAILGSLRLVPLVNVTSIDPHASTAFSVIFIPKSEASTFGSYLDNLYDYKYGREDLSRESGYTDEQIRNAAEQRSLGRKNALAVDSAESGKSRRNVMAQDGQTSLASKKVAEDISLLDEYISATGSNETRDAFNKYVKAYTSDVIRNVESGIDVNDIANNLPDTQHAAKSSDLIAVKKISPSYPKRARARGIEGYSIVEYAVDNRGQVIDPVIVDSNPGSVFDRSSLRAIQQTLFEPPRVNGEIVSIKGQQTKFVYQLKPG